MMMEQSASFQKQDEMADAEIRPFRAFFRSRR
jgi:hypothetical protein